VWEALSEFFLDTELDAADYLRISRELAASRYSESELEAILLHEVYPACKANLMCVAGEWSGFHPEWIRSAMTARLGRRRRFLPLFRQRWMCDHHWKAVRPLIVAQRQRPIPPPPPDDSGAPIELPPRLRWLRGSTWTPITIGKSRAHVFLLRTPSGDSFVLKSAAHDAAPALAQEAERLRWLRERLPVPSVVQFLQWNEREYLLETVIPGENAATADLPAGTLADLCGDALRRWHSVPIRSCPFAWSTDEAIAEARQRLNSGALETDDFDVENLGRDPHELFAEMLTLTPKTEAPTLIHGDFCLPNIMIHGGQISGFVDVGCAGVGDPYRDLALVCRSFEHNAKGEAVPVFLKCFGLPNPDQQRLRFFRLLDEFL